MFRLHHPSTRGDTTGTEYVSDEVITTILYDRLSPHAQHPVSTPVDNRQDTADERRSYRRRTVVAALGVGAVTGCLRAGTQPDGSPTGAPTETGDTTETPSETATPTGPVSLSQAWGSFFEPEGEPLPADETLYIGSNAGVRAIATGDGTERWRSGDERVTFAGSLDGDGLYYTTPLYDGVTRLDRDSGEVLASTEFGPAGARPAVAGDHVVVGTNHNAGSDGPSNTLAGFSKTDLTQSWSVSDPDVKYTDGLGYDGRAIVGFGESPSPQIQARDPGTGAVDWSLDGYIIDPLQVHEGALYAPLLTNGVELVRIDPTTGDVAWRHTLEQRRESRYVFSAAPALHEGRAYLASYWQVHAIDLETGETDWTVTTDQPVDARPALVGDYLWVVPRATPDQEQDGQRSRQLLGFDPESGDLQVERQLTASTRRPFAFGSRLGVLMADRVAAFDVEATG
jgi:outer membrane protein assembly factor BamB